MLKPGRDLPLRKGHLWVHSGAVQELEAEPGEVVDVLNHRGRFVARGHRNPNSQIAIRVFTRKREAIDRSFFRKRLQHALTLRRPLERLTDAVRLVHSEGDLLPGLVLDRYGGHLALQIHTASMERSRGVLVDLLVELFNPRGIWDRSDPEARRKEGLGTSEGPLYGEVPELMEVEEGSLRFLVDVRAGQKTGFYLDRGTTAFAFLSRPHGPSGASHPSRGRLL